MGTVDILEERIEHCMPAWWATQATKAFFHCTLAVAFLLELIKQAGLYCSHFMLILVRYAQLNALGWKFSELFVFPTETC